MAAFTTKIANGHIIVQAVQPEKVEFGFTKLGCCFHTELTPEQAAAVIFSLEQSLEAIEAARIRDNPAREYEGSIKAGYVQKYLAKVQL